MTNGLSRATLMATISQEGITSDSKRVGLFHISPNGGGFFKTEIYTLTNPTRNEVLRIIRSLNTDFLGVYVSAHGYTSQYGERMICLTDKPIEDRELLNHSRWQYIVVEVSRTAGARIGGIEWPEEPCQNFTGETWARTYFERCLEQTPPGKMIIHATSHHLPAYEDTIRIGGQFTLALLDVIRQYQNSKQKGYLTVDQLLPLVQRQLRGKPNPQFPQIVYRTPNFAVPMTVVLPDLIIPKDVRNQPLEQNKNWQMLAVLSLLTIVAYSVSK